MLFELNGLKDLVFKETNFICKQENHIALDFIDSKTSRVIKLKDNEDTFRLNSDFDFIQFITIFNSSSQGTYPLSSLLEEGKFTMRQKMFGSSDSDDFICKIEKQHKESLVLNETINCKYRIKSVPKFFSFNIKSKRYVSSYNLGNLFGGDSADTLLVELSCSVASGTNIQPASKMRV